VSIGLAPTKVLAKVASNWVKPNGLTIIEADAAPDFLAKVPIGKVWGIGPRTAEVLIRRGVKNALEFREKDLAWVKRCLSKPYEAIWRELNGVLIMDVDTKTKNTYLSIQKTRTFHPSTNDKTFLWSQVSKHIEDACRKARYYELTPKRISIFLKTADFKIVSASATLPAPSNSPEISLSSARSLFNRIHTKGITYRTAGVTLDDLTADFEPQADLFGGTTKGDKFDLIHKQIDSLENKLGKRVVHLGSTHEALLCKELGTDADELDRDLLFL
jgi:nucleotidyltransferase/DNA polymerase involved in DNA repair